MTWLSIPPPASAASPDPWYPPWVLAIALILAAWFAVSVIAAPLIGRWLRNARERSEGLWAQQESSGAVRVLDDDDPRVRARKRSEGEQP